MATPFSRTTRALNAESPRRAWWAWGLCALLGLAWMGWFFGGSVTLYEVSRTARLEVQQSAHAVPALQAGRVVRTVVALGRTVQAGEVLLELDSRSAKLRLQEETTRLAALPARVTALQNELAALQAALLAEQNAGQAATQSAQARVSEASAQAEFAREHARRIDAEPPGTSLPEIDALRANADARRQAARRDALAAEQRRQGLDHGGRVQQSQARIHALRGALAQLMAEQDTQRATVARWEVEVERHVLRAPVAGTVADLVPLPSGSYVTEGQTVATILPAGQLRVVALFNPASALGRLRAGLSAELRLDGFPWAQFGSAQAHVAQVAAELHEQLLRVELTLQTPSAQSRLPMQHGLPGQVEVALEQVSPAALLLRAAGQLFSPTTTVPPAR